MARRILALVFILASTADVNCQNVLGIDFGSEFIKLAIVQRSAGLQIVLNEATKRKSPNALAFGEAQREFGDTAMVKPHLAFTHTRELLGKSARAELEKIYGPHYFPYEIIADDERGAIKIKESDRFLSPEVLVAMVLTYAKSLAQAQANEKVVDCVITVPAYYRQFERQAMLDAAAIAGLNVLSLVNDHTAVALKYGTDNNVADLKEPLNVMFYDMGSTATRVSLVQYSAIPDKESFDKNKTLGQLKVLSVAWDETLGGKAFTEVVHNILKGKSKKDPSGNSRALAKLGVAADKAKVILSANKEAHPSVESFIEDYDFRASISRAEFEDGAAKLFERVLKPVDEVLRKAIMPAGQAQPTLADVHRVEMVGAGWRVPKVQEVLLAYTKRPILDKTMNGDEAFCFGAALYAASQSNAFRLRKFGVHDTTQFGVSIDFDSAGGDAPEDDEEDAKADEAPAAGGGGGRKSVGLFKVGHKVPTKRVIAFKQRTDDFAFTLRYDGQLPPGTPSVIAEYNVTGLAAALARYPNATKHKVNVEFRLNRSGLVGANGAEVELEEMVDVEVCQTVKLNASANASANASDPAAAAAAAAAPPPDVAADAAKEPKEEGKEEVKEAGKGNETETEAAAVEQKVCSVKQERRVRRVRVKVTVEPAAIRPLSPAEISSAREVLKGYDDREAQIRERASAFNGLESYIYVTREKLEGNADLLAVTTEDFRAGFGGELTKMNEWLEQDGWSADTETLRVKLGELRKMGDPAFARVRELVDRPDVVRRAREAAQAVDAALVNVTKERSWLNKSFIAAVANRTQALRDWLDNVTAAQEAHPPDQDPIFTKDLVERRVAVVEEALRGLLKMRRPPPPPLPKKEKKPKDKKGSKADGAPAPQADPAEGAPAPDASPAAEAGAAEEAEGGKEPEAGDKEAEPEAGDKGKEELR